MSLLFPRLAYAPVRCGPARNEIAPLFSLFDDTFNEIQRASRHHRRQFNPRFDVKEAKDSYQLEGELPGVDQKDIAIEFTDEHTLTIKGRTERHIESGKRPESQPKAVEADTTAETSSVKSNQPTVEDEEPANASAVNTEATTTEQPEQNAQATEKAEQTPEQQYWISERSVGSFSRSFSFASRVDQDAVKASLKNGILSIVIPKAPVPESRRINIE